MTGTRISDMPTKTLVAGDLAPVISGGANYTADIGAAFVAQNAQIATGLASLYVPTRAALAALTPVAEQVVYLAASGHEGFFVWSASNHAADVTAAPSPATMFVAPASASTGASGAWVRVRLSGAAQASWFGAVGDGSTANTTILNTAIAYCLANGITLLKLGNGVFNIINVTIPALGPQSANPSNYAQLEIQGVAPPANIQGDVGTTGVLTNTGTILKGNPTTGSALAVLPYGGSFSNVKIKLTNLEIRTYDNPTCSGVDMGWAAQFEYENLNINTGTWGGLISAPTTTTSFGLKYPRRGNFGVSYGRGSQVAGYYTGRICNELTNSDQDLTIYCHQAYSLTTADHAIKLGYVGIFNCPYGISVDGACRFEIEFLDIEHASSGWSVSEADLYDNGSAGDGWINWSIVDAGVGQATDFVKVGGDRVDCKRIGGVYPQFNQFASSSATSVPTGADTQVAVSNLSPAQNETGFTLSGGGLTVTVAGWYRVVCTASFASNATGYRELRQYKNGAFGSINQNAVNGAATAMSYLGEGYFAVGDTVSIHALQNSGGSLNVTGSLSMTLLRSVKG